MPGLLLLLLDGHREGWRHLVIPTGWQNEGSSQAEGVCTLFFVQPDKQEIKRQSRSARILQGHWEFS